MPKKLEEFKLGDIVLVEHGEVHFSGSVKRSSPEPYRISQVLKSLYWIQRIKDQLTDQIGKSPALPRPPKSKGQINYFHRIIGKAGDGYCRVCGCTEQDCSQCIERTGHPCHWAEPDLCSACAVRAA